MNEGRTTFRIPHVQTCRKRIKNSFRPWLSRYPILHGMYDNRFRWFTGPFRMLPDFIIIGAAKCGTTSLYDFIVKHPAIGAAKRKEVHYFADKHEKAKLKYGEGSPAVNQEKFGVNWYRSNFPTKFKAWAYHNKTNQRMLTGEATPQYLIHPGVPETMINLLPNAKLIVILRNPTDRAYSAYNHNRRNGVEDLSFEDAIKQDLAGQNTRHIRNYLNRGHYAEHLERWFKHYDREQFLILTNDELREKLQDTMNKVFKFLGVVPFQIEGPENLNVGHYESMSEKIRKYLIEYYRPHNVRLTKLLGRCFDWDR